MQKQIPMKRNPPISHLLFILLSFHPTGKKAPLRGAFFLLFFLRPLRRGAQTPPPPPHTGSGGTLFGGTAFHQLPQHFAAPSRTEAGWLPPPRRTVKANPSTLASPARTSSSPQGGFYRQKLPTGGQEMRTGNLEERPYTRYHTQIQHFTAPSRTGAGWMLPPRRTAKARPSFPASPTKVNSSPQGGSHCQTPPMGAERGGRGNPASRKPG